MHFHRVEEVAPFVRVIGGDAIARNGAGHREDGIALLVQRQYGRGNACPRRRHLTGVVETFKVLFHRAAFWLRKRAGDGIAKGMQEGEAATSGMRSIPPPDKQCAD
jgi:hypothetical protein